jgi:hypothetical protein
MVTVYQYNLVAKITTAGAVATRAVACSEATGLATEFSIVSVNIARPVQGT